MLRRSVLVLPLLLSFACTTSDDTGPDTDTDTDTDTDDPEDDFWLVGDDGTMLAVAPSGDSSGYPLTGDADLLAIACFGQRSAYVVGAAGTLLQTRDTGRSWTTLELGSSSAESGAPHWTAVAAAEATPEGIETVWVVGHEGLVARTSDGAASWSLLPDLDSDFTGVATQPDGELALAVAEDGGIWRLTPEGSERLYLADRPLRAVGLADHDGQAVAVGDGGLVLTSSDAGEHWSELPLDSSRDLHAVRVSGHEHFALAVGEAGVIVRIVENVAEITNVPELESDLYGLHLRHDGSGQAVGSEGTLLRTSDAGQTWVEIPVATTQTLRGVDDFHVGGHL